MGAELPRRAKKTRAKAGYGIKHLRSHHCWHDKCDLNFNNRMCQEINVEIAVEQCRASDLKAYPGVETFFIGSV